MTHGRFEFNLDFSEPQPEPLDHDALALQQDRIGDAYRAGYEDGQQVKENESLEMIRQLLTKMSGAIATMEQSHQSASEKLFATLAISLDAFLTNFVGAFEITTILTEDRFGLASILDSLTGQSDLKIFVSPDMQALLEGEAFRFPQLSGLPILSDQALRGHDFEIRWHDGGAIYEAESLMQTYRATIKKSLDLK